MAEQQQMTPEDVKAIIIQALNSGIPEQEIIDGLSKDLQISPEEAASLIEAAKAEGGAAEPAAEPTGVPQVDGVSIEEAMTQLDQIGISPEQLLQVLEVIMSISPDDIDDLAAMVQETLSGGGAAPAEMPPQEQMQI